LEARECPAIWFDEFIFIVLLTLSMRITPLKQLSLHFKMARLQQIVSKASANAPDGSSSKERLIKLNRWFLLNITNDAMGDELL